MNPTALLNDSHFILVAYYHIYLAGLMYIGEAGREVILSLLFQLLFSLT